MPKKGGWRSPTRSVHGSDLENKALGAGSPTSADKAAGKQNARWANANLTTGAGAPVGTVSEYDVAHDLGKIPAVVTLKEWENSAVPQTTITARGIRRENWSATHVHVEITLLSGSFDGTLATFLVEGR
jgi:hypothetical protein